MKDILILYGFKKHSVIPNLYVRTDGMYKAVNLKGIVYLMTYSKLHDKYSCTNTINTKNKLKKVLELL